jgi:hypothetical protein
MVMGASRPHRDRSDKALDALLVHIMPQKFPPIIQRGVRSSKSDPSPRAATVPGGGKVGGHMVSRFTAGLVALTKYRVGAI